MYPEQSIFIVKENLEKKIFGKEQVDAETFVYQFAIQKI